MLKMPLTLVWPPTSPIVSSSNVIGLDLSDLPKFCKEYFDLHFPLVENTAKYTVHFHRALSCHDRQSYEFHFSVDTPMGYFMNYLVKCETDLEDMFIRLREVSQETEVSLQHQQLVSVLRYNHQFPH